MFVNTQYNFCIWTLITQVKTCDCRLKPEKKFKQHARHTMLYCASYTVSKMIKLSAVSQQWYVSLEEGVGSKPLATRVICEAPAMWHVTLWNKKKFYITRRSHPMKLFSINSDLTCVIMQAFAYFPHAYLTVMWSRSLGHDMLHL